MLIGSLNCNGLRDQNKVQLVKHLIDREKIDVLFLQETHIDTLNFGRKVACKLGGHVFWSFGQPRGRGVAIFVSKTVNLKVQRFVCDPFGRFILLDVNIDGKSVRFFNVYAPNIPAQRRQFYKDIYGHFVTPKTIVLGGDFNCISNPKLDKIGGNANRGVDGWAELSTLLTDFRLKDVFRNKFPNQVAATWRSSQVSCRLDRMYLPTCQLDSVNFVKHIINSFSDHDLVLVSLSSWTGVETGK